MPDIHQGGPFSATSEYFQNKLSCPKARPVRPQTKGSSRRKSFSSPFSSGWVPREHLPRSLLCNLVSPFLLPPWELRLQQAMLLQRAAQSPTAQPESQGLAAEFKPCHCALFVAGEPDSLCTAAAPHSPADLLLPPTCTPALTGGRSTALNPRSALPLSALSLRPQKWSFLPLPGQRGSEGRARGASPASPSPDGHTERKHKVISVCLPAESRGSEQHPFPLTACHRDKFHSVQSLDLEQAWPSLGGRFPCWI